MPEETLDRAIDGETVRLGMTRDGAGPLALPPPALSSNPIRAEMAPLAAPLAPRFETLAVDWPGFGALPHPRRAWGRVDMAAFLGSDAGGGKQYAKGSGSSLRPPVLAGQEDVGPSEGRCVRQELGRAVQPGALPHHDGATEALGVPVDDDGCEQVEPGDPIVPPFARPVADFALAPDAQGVRQGMVRLALVEPVLGAAPHVGVEQP